MDALTYNQSRQYSSKVFAQIQRVVGAEPTSNWTADMIATVIDFQADHQLDQDGKVGPRTLEAILIDDACCDEDDHDDDDHDHDDHDDDPRDEARFQQVSFDTTALAGSGVEAGAEPLDQLRQWCGDKGFELVDFRDLKQWPRNKVYPKDYGYPRNKNRATPPKQGIHRKWKNITSFMLHTTSVGGMTAKRGLGIPTHFFLPREDAIVLCHELDLLIYHGHAGNKFSVGLEISGVSDWDGPSQVERAKTLLRYFQAVRRMEVGEDATCYVMAHRQTHESRGKDPGKQIWRDVGEWAIEELGFELGPVVGSGRSVDEWRG